MDIQIPPSIEKWISVHPEAMIIESSIPIQSTGDAYQVLDDEKRKYVKTLILQNRKTGKVVATIIKGGSNVSRRDIDEAVSARSWHFVSKQQMEDISGFPAYAVPPVCLKNVVKAIYVDPRVVTLHEIIAQAGTSYHFLKTPPKYILEDPRTIVKPVSIG